MTTQIARLNGSTSLVWTSPPNQKGNGFVHVVFRKRRKVRSKGGNTSSEARRVLIYSFLHVAISSLILIVILKPALLPFLIGYLIVQRPVVTPVLL